MIKMIPGSSLCDQNSGSYSHICDFQPANLSATKSATQHAKIGCLTCTPKGISMSFPVDLEGHGIYQNAWNGNLVKMVPLRSMSDQKQGKSYQNWLPDMPKLATQHVQYTKITSSMSVLKWAIVQVPSTTDSQTRHPLSLKRRRSKNCMVMFLKELGCFPGKSYHINLDESVTPVQTRCRPVPVHLKEVFKQEINKMLDAGILKPFKKSTPWINSFDDEKTQMEPSNSESVWIQPIWKRQSFVNLIAARPQRTLHIF